MVPLSKQLTWCILSCAALGDFKPRPLPGNYTEAECVLLVTGGGGGGGAAAAEEKKEEKKEESEEEEDEVMLCPLSPECLQVLEKAFSSRLKPL